MVIETTASSRGTADTITGHAGTSSPKDVGHAQRTTRLRGLAEMVKTRANRTMFGKLTGNHTATLGQFSGEGRTKTEAVAKLHGAIEAMDTRRAYLVTGEGIILAVRQAIGGSWGYDIIRPNGVEAIIPSCWGSKTFEQAIAHATDHAAQSYGGVVKVLR